MGERCGCVSAECTCAIYQGDGLIIQGTGSKTNPHTIEIGPTATKVVGVPSSYVDVAVTGNGTATSPYSVKMVKSLLSPPAVPRPVQTYLTPGTYTLTKPTGCTLVAVTLIGGGGGGMTGVPAGGGKHIGGLGGGSAGRLVTRVPVSTTAFDCTLTIGSGGTGGSDGTDTSIVLPDPAGTLTLQATGGIRGGAGGLGSQTGQATSATTQPLLLDLRPGGGGRGASTLEADGPTTGTGGGKHAQFATVRTNLIKNPRFETGIGGWQNRTNSTVSWNTTTIGVGAGALKAVATASGLTEVQQIATGVDAFPVIAGQTYAYIASMMTSVANRNLGLSISYYDATGTFLVSHAVAGVNSGGPSVFNPIAWQEVVPAGAFFARVIAYSTNMLAGEWFLLDQVLFEKTTVTYPTFFDGDTPASSGVAYDWSGVRGDSYSTAMSETSAQSVALRGGGTGGDGGDLGYPGENGSGPGAGGGGGGGGGIGVGGGRGGDGAAWITFY